MDNFQESWEIMDSLVKRIRKHGVVVKAVIVSDKTFTIMFPKSTKALSWQLRKPATVFLFKAIIEKYSPEFNSKFPGSWQTGTSSFKLCGHIDKLPHMSLSIHNALRRYNYNIK